MTPKPVWRNDIERDAWIKARVVHCNGGLWFRKDYQWKGIGHTGTCSPLSTLNDPKMTITVIVDDQGLIASFPATLQSMDGNIWKLLWNNWDKINHA